MFSVLRDALSCNFCVPTLISLWVLFLLVSLDLLDFGFFLLVIIEEKKMILKLFEGKKKDFELIRREKKISKLFEGKNLNL